MGQLANVRTGLCDSFLVWILTDCLTDSRFFITTMDDTKKIYLQRLAEDEKTLEALKEELLTSLDDKKPNLELNNKDLGANTRGRELAKQMVEEGIKNIKRLKVIKRSERENQNPGR